MQAAQVLGREAELATVGDFVGAEPAPAHVLVIAGGPGIGKTTLWEAGVALARGRGLRVLATRSRDVETDLSLAGVSDLLDGVDLDALAGLPAPQRRALAAAMLRADAAGEPDLRAVAAGLLSVVRALAAAGPVLVAVDDAEWLDRDSGVAIGFAARRLERQGVGFLLATRSVGSAALEQAFETSQRQVLEVGPLGFGATRRLLSTRLGLILPRGVLRRLHDAAQGNPLLALELGLALARAGPREIGQELTVPASLDGLLGARVERLPPAERRVLLAVALSAGLSRRRLEEIASEEAVQAALDSGLVVDGGERVRPGHPLFAATAVQHAARGERRALHLDLAREAVDAQQEALHLALAAERPDTELSSRLAELANCAAARGAAGEAVELAGHALRLTAADARERPARLLALGEHLEAAGELQRLSELLGPEVEALPAGEPRVRAHMLLAEGGHIVHADQHAEHLSRALAEAAGDATLAAPVRALMSIHASVVRAEGIPAAEALALEALAAAQRSRPEAERLALCALAWSRALRGRAVDDLRARQGELGGGGAVDRSVDRVVAVRLAWRGETAAARAALASLRDASDKRGEAYSYLVSCLHGCELELRAGRWTAAVRVLDEWAESADFEEVRGLVYERCRALLAAGRGDAATAERWAGDALAAVEANGVGWQRLEALRARGLARLIAHDQRGAAADLRVVWQSTEREGIDDPGVFPVAPDLVEALVELGEHEEARAVGGRLHELAIAQEHPWGLLTARRCAALLEDEPGTAEEIAAGYERLGLPFDRARTLLALGRGARRRRRWSVARRLLEPAAVAFAELGSPAWADDARSELERVGGRRATPPGELTPSERRVVELAARGMANKEIARVLFISVHTVEVHLSRSYAKLGVRSRSQLTQVID